MPDDSYRAAHQLHPCLHRSADGRSDYDADKFGEHTLTSIDISLLVDSGCVVLRDVGMARAGPQVLVEDGDAGSNGYRRISEVEVVQSLAFGVLGDAAEGCGYDGHGGGCLLGESAVDVGMEH